MPSTCYTDPCTVQRTVPFHTPYLYVQPSGSKRIEDIKIKNKNVILENVCFVGLLTYSMEQSPS